MRVFSFILVIGSALIIAVIGAVSIHASAALLGGVLPAALGVILPWVCWAIAIALMTGIQVGECRPIYLAHLHTEAMDLYHQGSHPASNPPDIKALKIQLAEELGLNRSKQIWVRLFAIAITIVDFIWSCILFPPFKAGNDPGKVWSALIQYGLGAIDWVHVFLIAGNVALIPLCYLVFLKELSILSSGTVDSARGTAPAAAKPKTEPKAGKEEPRKEPKAGKGEPAATTPVYWFNPQEIARNGNSSNGATSHAK